MTTKQEWSVTSEEVLQVESKWSFYQSLQRTTSMCIDGCHDWTRGRNVFSLRFEWMCDTDRTICLRTEQREQVWESPIVIV